RSVRSRASSWPRANIAWSRATTIRPTSAPSRSSPASTARSRCWRGARPTHIPEKACLGLDPGWVPVFRQGYCVTQASRGNDFRLSGVNSCPIRVTPSSLTSRRVLIDTIDLRTSAVLLDVDGTLLDIAETPPEVEVPARLKQALQALRVQTG